MPKGVVKYYKKLDGPDRASFAQAVEKLPKGKQKKLAKVGKAIVVTREEVKKAVRKA